MYLNFRKYQITLSNKRQSRNSVDSLSVGELDFGLCALSPLISSVNMDHFTSSQKTVVFLWLVHMCVCMSYRVYL